MKKVVWFDLETTGLEENNCAIITGDFIMEFDGVLIDTYHFESRPHKGAYLTLEALEVNQIPLDVLKGLPSPEEAHLLLNNWFSKHIEKYNKLDKCIVAGYNPGFDIKFLSEFYIRQEDNFIGSFIDRRRVIDVRSVAVMAEERDRIPLLPNYKLVTLAEHFCIEFDAHNSAADIATTRIIYRNYLLPLLGLK